jgi:hypothetical protein
MDPLKDFFKRHARDFDHREPPAGAWKNISRSLWHGNDRGRTLAIWRAAAVLFFGLSAYLFFSSGDLGRAREVSRLQGEFKDLESFYTDQIAEKVSLIDDFENAHEDDQLTQDIQKLDAMYQVLQEEMKTKPSEKVKDALILNMLVRIDLLNQQIKKLEENRKKNPAAPAGSQA